MFCQNGHLDPVDFVLASDASGTDCRLTDRAADEEGARDSSRAQGDAASEHHRREKESQRAELHAAGSADQRDHRRSQRQRAGPGNAGRKSRVGKVRPGEPTLADSWQM